MAVRKINSKEVKVSSSEKGSSLNTAASKAKSRQRGKLDKAVIEQKKNEIKALHLAPLPLVFTVMICSGMMWVLAFRDVFATGRSIMGEMDAAMLVSWFS